MAENVSLSAAVRSNLLALQSTSELIARTQGRLSTGLRVASTIDDPVSFFQAKSLNDRADDFTSKKRGIDQGISTITAASDAVTGIEALVQQLKGLLLTAKSASTTTEVTSLVTQFNDLRGQINNLTADATYQGINLVNGTGSTLTVNFSNDTGSILNVASSDVRASRLGLDIAKLSATTSTDLVFNRAYISAGTVLGLSADDQTSHSSYTAISFTVGSNSAQTLSVGNTISATYDGYTFTITVQSTLSAVPGSNNAVITAGTYAVGTAIDFKVVTAGVLNGGANPLSEIFDEFSGGILQISAAAGVTITETEAIKTIGVGFSTELTNRVNNLDTALTTLRTRAQTLGTNVALLQTRLNFTKAYVSTLTTGAGKLTLADLNEEGANLLALQTRQQLGIQSLAFAGQSEQTILTLFR